jgi:hypothetical protein
VPLRKAGAAAGLEHLLAGIRLEDHHARQNIDELILLRVPVPGRGLAAGRDARQIDTEIGKPRMIAEPPVPPLLIVRAIGFRIAGGVGLGNRQGIENDRRLHHFTPERR